MAAAVSGSRPMSRTDSSLGDNSLAIAIPNDPEPRMAAEVNAGSGIGGFGLAGEAEFGARAQALDVRPVFPDGEDRDDHREEKQRLVPTARLPQGGQGLVVFQMVETGADVRD